MVFAFTMFGNCTIFQRVPAQRWPCGPQCSLMLGRSTAALSSPTTAPLDECMPQRALGSRSVWTKGNSYWTLDQCFFLYLPKRFHLRKGCHCHWVPPLSHNLLWSQGKHLDPSTLWHGNVEHSASSQTHQQLERPVVGRLRRARIAKGRNTRRRRGLQLKLCPCFLLARVTSGHFWAGDPWTCLGIPSIMSYSTNHM